MNSFGGLLLGGGTQVGLGVAFLAAAGAVVLAGIQLSRYGDALGERTGMGAGLVGLIFLAGITSLPELVVSTTSTLSASLKAMSMELGDARTALLAGGADLAVGNMLGSNVFNLMLVAVMDYVHGEGALLYRLSRKHILSAAGGLAMLGIFLFGLAFGRESSMIIPGLDVGVITPILLLGYVAAMVLQGRLEKRPEEEDDSEGGETEAVDEKLLRMSAVRFYGTLVLLAAVIVSAGMWLSMLGDRMSLPWEQGGFNLGKSFIGTFFLAVSTSLPELVICVTSVRMGALDMAAGNIFGSNMFNLVIIFTADVGLRGGSVLRYASLSHLITVAMVMILTSIAVVSMSYRSKRHFLNVGYDVWLMLLLYVGGNIAIFLLGR